MKRLLLIILASYTLAHNASAMENPSFHARDLHLTTAEDRPVEGSLKALVTGGKPPYKFIEHGSSFPPLHSSLQLNSDGTFTYTPSNNFIGQGLFQYKAIDSQGVSSNVGTVYINIEDYY